MKTKNFFFTTLLLMLFSCSEKQDSSLKTYKYNPTKDQLFKIGVSTNSLHTPLQFLPVWNYETIEKLNLAKITVYSLGGKNPSDTLQLNQFNFDIKNNNVNFSEKGNTPTGEYVSYGKYRIINEKITKIDLRIVDEEKKEKVFITKIISDPKVKTILRYKENNKIDSSFIYTIRKDLKINVIKIGNFIQSVQFFIPQNSKTSELKKLFEQLNFDKNVVSTTTLSVVYTKNSLPIEAYSLNDEFVQFAKEKEWKYTKNKCLEKYIEYYNNSIIKTVSFSYSSNFLPKKMTVNNIHYYFDYQ